MPIYVYYVITFYALSRGMTITQPRACKDIWAIVAILCFFPITYTIFFMTTDNLQINFYSYLMNSILATAYLALTVIFGVFTYLS